MRVKAKVVVDAAGGPEPAIKGLMEHKGFAARVAYRLARLLRKLEDELAVLDGRMKGLQAKHGLKFERGQQIEESSLPEAYRNDVRELFETEIEVNVEPVELPPDAEIVPEELVRLVDFVTVKD